MRSELSWTHYRILLGVENYEAREWYINESIAQSWTARALERQIDKLYYERLLSSKDKQPVINEAKKFTDELKLNPKDYLRDTYILDFMDLPNFTALETDLEQALINNLQNFFLEAWQRFCIC